MLNRRKLLMGGALLAGGGWLIKPTAHGARHHDEFFMGLSETLDRTGLAAPSLLIDQKKLDQNITTITSHLANRFDYRVVAKSLPSIPMLQYVMEKSNTKKLMVFHLPFLMQVVNQIPQADVLMGKPMPVQAAESFYRDLQESSFNDENQLQWLIDSVERLKQYRELAGSVQRRLNINIELNIGLHRGGVEAENEFIQMLTIIEDSEYLNFSGLMGYEPHIGKVPGDATDHRDAAMDRYWHFVRLAETHLKRSILDLCLNGAGSPTYQYYNQGDVSKYPMNELSAGSCLVKPTDFDVSSLADHLPAAYIAAPVLKVLEQTQIPGVSGLGSLLSMWNPNWQKTFFIYGGNWKALPESPAGLTLNPVYGRSSNQEMLNGSANVSLKQDDWVFLRPTQSEAVFLQFGDMLLTNNKTIVQRWPVLKG